MRQVRAVFCCDVAAVDDVVVEIAALVRSGVVRAVACAGTGTDS